MNLSRLVNDIYCWLVIDGMGSICDGNVSSPLVADDAGYLSFFTSVLERLEGGALKERQLVEEKSRNFLACTSSPVFSQLLRFDPDFDFDTVIAPVPGATQEALASWMDDHVDALVREFAPEDDVAVIVVDEDEDAASCKSATLRYYYFFF